MPESVVFGFPLFISVAMAERIDECCFQKVSCIQTFTSVFVEFGVKLIKIIPFEKAVCDDPAAKRNIVGLPVFRIKAAVKERSARTAVEKIL